MAPEVLVESRLLGERLVTATLHDSPMVQHQDLIDLVQGHESVCEQKQ